MQKVNVKQMLGRFDDHWNPRIIGELNGQQVKVAKLLGEFEWHFHRDEDELFWVVSGELEMRWRDAEGNENVETLTPGEFLIVPKGIEHQPVAREEVEVMLFEPASTLNTGNVESDRTRNQLERLT